MSEQNGQKTLSIGSRVKIIKSDPGCPSYFIGEEGTIIDITPADENFPEDMYSVKISNGKSDGFYEDELVLIK
jgi:hypothetical protein